MATIRDVALAAGVSPATVSRVFNENTRVNPELARAVRAAAKRLNYRPSHVARNLRARATSVWGVVVADIENPFFTSMVRAVQDVAWAAGYSVVVCNSDEDVVKETRALEVLEAERVAGIILAPASEVDSNLGPIIDAGIPLVAIDRRPAKHNVDLVLVDNRIGAGTATTHLLENGCRRIGCITGPQHATTARERLEGYTLALTRAGHDVDPELIRHSDFKEEGGLQATAELLALDHPIDGLFVANNLMTLGAFEALDNAGLRVPADVAVVGFDDVPWVPLLRSRVTAVVQPTYEIGRRAAELLAARVSGWTGPVKEIVLTPGLQVRESSLRRAEARS